MRQPLRRRSGARAPFRLGGALVLGGLLAASSVLPASAAPAGWAGWAPVTGPSRSLVTTMTQRPAGFPVATVTSTSVAGSGVGVQTGASTFLPPQTPPGQVYGSSRNQAYLNLRPAGLNGGPSSVTTYTFARPTPASGWTFVLGDVDADEVSVSATDADGDAVGTADLGFRGVFNYCAAGVTPKPACGPPNNDGTDLPTWIAGTATLRGNPGALDSAGASGWFEPSTALATLTFRYTRRSGSPVYQTWFSSLEFDLAGTVTAPGDQASGLLVELLDPSGVTVGETRTDDEGRYRFAGRAPYDDYEVRLSPPDGLTSDGPLARPVDLSTADRTDVDFALRTLAPVSVAGTVRDDDRQPVADVTVTLTQADGDSREETTDGAGRYRFEDVPDGTSQRLTVTVPDGATVTPAERDVTVPVGSEEPVTGQDFTLTRPTAPAPSATVEGTLTDETGAPVPGAEVDLVATGTDDDPRTVSSDDDGQFRFPGVDPGSYVASVEPPEGYRSPQSQTVTVADGDTTRVDFVLEAAPTAPEPSQPVPSQPVPRPTSSAPTSSAPAGSGSGPAASGGDEVLAATGGVPAGVGVLGVLGVAAGASLLLARRRRGR